MTDTDIAEGRVAVRQRRVRGALVEAAYRVITEKGVDAATMQEIAERADVGAGTIYSYFRSKEELAIAVIEKVMRRLAVRIEQVTDTFDDPAQVYAFGVRMVMEAATLDPRWRQLLNRCEVIADAVTRCMGPFAMRDLRQAAAAGRFDAMDAEVVFRAAAYAMVGVSLAVVKGELPPQAIDETVVRLLCMAGLDAKQASELAARPRPPLPEE